jgi:hypothetical protein
MACKCVDKLEKLLIEKFGDGYLDTTLPVDRSSCEAVIRFYYHKRKNGGGEEVRERTSPIVASFCPFCGKKYAS